MTLHQDLPEHIFLPAVELLIDALTDCILLWPGLQQPLSDCELQPTTRAAGLAARAAVMVLLAHELGQEVQRDAYEDAASHPRE